MIMVRRTYTPKPGEGGKLLRVVRQIKPATEEAGFPIPDHRRSQLIGKCQSRLWTSSACIVITVVGLSTFISPEMTSGQYLPLTRSAEAAIFTSAIPLGASASPFVASVSLSKS